MHFFSIVDRLLLSDNALLLGCHTTVYTMVSYARCTHCVIQNHLDALIFRGMARTVTGPLRHARYDLTQAHAAATAQLAEGPQGHPLLMQAMELLEQKEQEARGGTATPTATTAAGGGGGGSAAAPAAATSVPAAEEEFGERMQQEEGGGEEAGGGAADDAGSLGF